MKVNTNYIIRYLRLIYGGKAMYHKCTLIIKVEGEEFQVKLLSRNALGNYVFTHINSGNQFEDRDLAHGIFLAWNYKFYNEYGYPLEEEDWHRFINDAYRYAEDYYVNSKSLC